MALLILPPASSGWAQRPSVPTQNPMAGSWVFGAKGCANCHAINGVGKTIGPDLGRGELRSHDDLAAAFWNHYPGMAVRMREQGIEPPRISPADMGDLIAFLTAVNYFDPRGSVERGQTTFVQKQCVRCHQVRGVGGVLGPNLDHLGQTGSAIEVATALWNHAGPMSGAMVARGISRPSFSADELTDLLAYLRGSSPAILDRPLQLFPGRPDAGERLYTDQGCVRCHGVGGRGGGLAPPLAQRERSLSLLEFAATMWNKAPAMLRMMLRQGIAVPKLEADQMADIVAYLSTVQYFQPTGSAGAGRAHLESRGCLGCHSLDGRGTKGGVDLAKVVDLDSKAAVIAALWNHGNVAPRTAADITRWPKLTARQAADIAAFFIARGGAR